MVVPAGETVIAAVVAPVLQRYVPPPDAVSVTGEPAHIAAEGGAMAAIGSGLTLIVVVNTAVQPNALVTVTEYGVVEAGVTVIICVVAPVLHR